MSLKDAGIAAGGECFEEYERVSERVSEGWE